MGKDESYTNKFSELSKASILVAGGKGANLGEMTQAGFAVPSSIVVNTAPSFVSEALNSYTVCPRSTRNPPCLLPHIFLLFSD